MTSVRTRTLENHFRHDVIKLLNGNNNLGVELGVAEGIFSERMLKSEKFSMFFGIDMYADLHDTHQYKRALSRVGLFANYKLLRMTFKEALDLFEDQSLDFVYVDGYAHSGEEGGETIFDWFKKVKIGGVISGDDYHEDWPLVMKAVDEFICQTGFELLITDKTEPNTEYCQYPSWAIIKTHELDIVAPSEMVQFGKATGQRIASVSYKSRPLRQFILSALKKILSARTVNALKSIRRKLSNL